MAGFVHSPVSDHADPYIRRCDARRVVDGDTLYLYIDKGFDDYSLRSVRLLGVDAPELRGDTYEAAVQSRLFTTAWLADHRLHCAPDERVWPFIIHSSKDDSFGRYLAYLTCHQGHCLNQALLDNGHAVPRFR